jgi:hypothetical protein
VTRVRTTYREPQEDVYVYRLHGPRENLRGVLLDYVQTMNEVPEHSRTTNCTTTALMRSHVNPESPPWLWKVLLSRYTAAVRLRAREAGSDSADRGAGAAGLGQRACSCRGP